MSKDERTKNRITSPAGRKGGKMKYNIIIEGTRYNENYTFETPEEGDVLKEVADILKEIEKGGIDRVEIKPAETKEAADKAGTSLFFRWRQLESKNEAAIKVFKQLNIQYEYDHYGRLMADFYGVGLWETVEYKHIKEDVFEICRVGTQA
jgi:hypothetical protein